MEVTAFFTTYAMEQSSMKWFIRHVGLVWIAIVVVDAGAQKRAFTVKDDVEMVRFTDPSMSDKGALTKFSPDGKYFAIVTSRGIIKSDQIESQLAIFSSKEAEVYVDGFGLSTPPKPLTTIRMKAVLRKEQTSTYGSAIAGLRWSRDSRYLYFLAESSDGKSCRLYRSNSDGKHLIAISPEGQHVVDFDFTKNLIVYSAWTSHRSSEDTESNESYRINADARAVTGQSLNAILFPDSPRSPTSRRLWLVRTVNDRPSVTPVPGAFKRDLSVQQEAFALSPKGDLLIHLQPITAVPTDWGLYEPAKGFEHLRIKPDVSEILADDNILRLKQYSLTNLHSGRSQALVQAPHDFALAYGGQSSVVWSPDEHRVLLTDTFLPLGEAGKTERSIRLRPCALADIQLASLEARCIVFKSEFAVGEALADPPTFEKDDTEVDLGIRNSAGDIEKIRYVIEDDRWQRAPLLQPGKEINPGIESQQYHRQLQIAVRQNLNEPPTLWVTNVNNRREKKLWDPNPQFEHLILGTASSYSWKDRTGHVWSGGLVMPVGYTSGKRYPLVIQIYNFKQNQFMTDGSFPSAMSARALASAGILVLQVQRRFPHTFDDSEAQTHVEAFRSAVESLENAGLADPGRVGLVGFSVSAWYVENALIRDPRRFKAATIAEGIDMSYMQYRLWGVSDHALRGEIDKIMGSEPMGKGLENWLKFAPGFNLDKIVTPLRIEAMTPSSILGEWEVYSSLRQQGKPVDLIYFPEGQHVHQRPLERLASQQGDVDWFRFWLQDYEDPDPTKAEQYKQWAHMRKVQAVANKEPIGQLPVVEAKPN
jgi:dipeptidyl aminopeptidase/acylaminoacyl peptidase